MEKIQLWRYLMMKNCRGCMTHVKCPQPILGNSLVANVLGCITWVHDNKARTEPSDFFVDHPSKGERGLLFQGLGSKIGTRPPTLLQFHIQI